MSNQSNDFNTPPQILEPIYTYWPEGIDLDPCSNPGSMVKSHCSLSLPTNGLNASWGLASPHGSSKVFVNPPYAPYYLRDDGAIILTPKEFNGGIEDVERSRYTRYTIHDWLRKGYAGAPRVESIFLIPCRGMGSRVWQEIILPNHSGICFLKKRFPFWENGGPCKGPDGTVNPGTFDCALVHFGGDAVRFHDHFSTMGYVQIGH